MRNYFKLLALLITIASQSSSTTRVAPPPPIVTGIGSSPVPGLMGKCFPETAKKGAQVVALGAYEGKTYTSFSIPDSSQDSGMIAVTGNAAGPPVILILSAYDPVIWDLRPLAKRRLRGVVLYGYHEQAVVGVPKGMPIRFSTGSRADPACGPSVFAYEGGPKLDRLASVVERAVGLSITRFYGGYAPVGFHIDGGRIPAPDPATLRLEMLVGSRDFARDKVVPKEAGLTQLIAEGSIRKAEQRDISALETAMTGSRPTGHLAPSRAAIGHRGYIVLRPITVPKGMFGAHSAVFLIPAGVPMPRDFR